MSVVVYSEQFGPVELEELDLECLCEWTGQSRDTTLERLQEARFADMADSWRSQSPTTDDDIIDFYATTDLYVWELLAWNSSPEYDHYRRRLERLRERFPPSSHPRVLDYGSGVGTAALWLAAAGYEVTVADVPGPTFEFAQKRLRRHGAGFEALEIRAAMPRLGTARFDLVVSFDVLEHLTHPAEMARRLARAVRPGGGAAIVAAFGHDAGDHPHHLNSRSRSLEGHRFDPWLALWGLRVCGDSIYSRMTSTETLPSWLNYALWRCAGVQVRRIPR